MAGPIKFHERSKGCVEAGESASEGVSIVEPRVKFVRGYMPGDPDPAPGSVECGDGTEYPLKVTSDQLFEILYRVQNAYLSAGLLTLDISGSEDWEDNVIEFEVVPPTDPDNLPLVAEGDENGEYYYKKGFHLFADPATFPPSYLAPFFAASSYAIPPSIDNPFPSGEEVFEVLNDPLVLWLQYPSEEFLFTQTNLEVSSSSAFDHAFYYSDAYSTYDPIDYGVLITETGTGIGPAECYFDVGDNVAWVDKDGSGDPFSAGNEIYLGFNFMGSVTHVNIELEVNSVKDLYTPDDGYSMEELTNKFILELSGGVQVSFPLYVYYSDSGSATLVETGSDIVLKAHRWWDYKNKDGSSVWDTSTGERL